MTFEPSGVFRESFSAFRRNFLKLFLVLGIYIAIIAVPYMLWLPDYAMSIASGIEGEMIDPFYMFFYIMVAIFPILLREFFIFLAICIALGPLFMGAAGRLLYNDMRGQSMSLKQAFDWGAANYKNYFAANFLYIVCIAGGALGGVAFLYSVSQMSHEIVESMFYPCVWITIGGNIFLLYCLSFIPVIAAEGKLKGVKIFTASFKTAVNKCLGKCIAAIACNAAIACAITVVCVLIAGMCITPEVDMLGIIPFDETECVYNVIMFVGFVISGMMLYTFITAVYKCFDRNIHSSGKTRVVKYNNTYKTTARRIYPPDVRRRIG